MSYDDPQTDTQAAIQAGVLSAAPQHIDGTPLYVVTSVDGTVKVIDLREYDAKYAQHPDRKIGEFTVGDAPSLIAYVLRHETAGTELWANLERRSILAILDGNGTEPGHSQHAARLVLEHTPEWKAWALLNRKAQTQAQFAEHIEDNLDSIADPSGSELLDLVTTLKVAKSADFESATRLSTGEVQFGYRETQTATAGKKGELTIPEVFTLAIAPFHGSPPYRVAVRLRYRMSEGNLALTYVLDQPEKILEHAFQDVLTDVTDKVENAPLFIGWPVGRI